MPSLTLYSAWYCPFAQRTWAALEHVKRPYTYVEIDPYDKTKFWLDVSRGLGQVPVITVENPDKAALNIPDSTRTLEYLEDTDRSGTLFSPDPDQRAEPRYWIDFQGREIIPHFYQFLRAERDSENAAQAKGRMISGLSIFAGAMSTKGDFCSGSGPDAVDFTFAPFALRIALLLPHYKGFHLPNDTPVWAHYNRWWLKIQANSALVKTMDQGDTYAEDLTKFYLPYASGGGQKDAATGAPVK